MRRWTGPLAVLLLSAAVAHGLALHFAPEVIMARAMAALSERGVALHRFTAPQRVTPQTQSIVRSSPDLYYALCRYDLRQPEALKHVVTSLTVTMAAWDDYQSLSFFDARTNNFATIRGTGKGIRVALRSGIGETGFIKPSFGYDPLNGGPTLEINAPTETGVILIRRLAATDEGFAKAVEAGKGDSCDFTVTPTIVY